MFKFPCPWCHSNLKTDGKDGHKGRCPKCKQLVTLISQDDLDLREMFPFVKWLCVKDGRSSTEHAQLETCGILGTNIFHRDDPVLDGWWIARRKGFRPCRCCESYIIKYETEKLGLKPVFVAAPAFDPWSDDSDCELMGWGSGEKLGWPDENYSTHPGNPDYQCAVAALAAGAGAFGLGPTYSNQGTICIVCGNLIRVLPDRSGSQVECPHCQRSFIVITFELPLAGPQTCPACGATMASESRKRKCENCGRPLMRRWGLVLDKEKVDGLLAQQKIVNGG